MYEVEIMFVGHRDAEVYRTYNYIIGDDGWLHLDDIAVNLTYVAWLTKTYAGGGQ